METVDLYTIFLGKVDVFQNILYYYVEGLPD